MPSVVMTKMAVLVSREKNALLVQKYHTAEYELLLPGLLCTFMNVLAVVHIHTACPTD